MNEKITEVKRQYAVPIYNLDNTDNIPIDELQLTITDQLFLDVLLMEIRGKAISCANHKKKEKDAREKYLLKSIKDLENMFSEDTFEQIEILKTELTNIRQEKLKGHILRSKAQYIDEGEKPTKYFCGLEKHNYISKIICKIEKEDGTRRNFIRN